MKPRLNAVIPPSISRFAEKRSMAIPPSGESKLVAIDRHVAANITSLRGPPKSFSNATASTPIE